MTIKERKALYMDFLTRGGASDFILTDALDKLGFFTAPASTKYHGAYEGGLFDHSLATAEELVDLTQKLGLKWERPESPYIVGLYHDLCKCDNYVKIIDECIPYPYEYNPKIIIPGHGDKSVIMLQKYIFLTDEEIACIRWHMGAYEKDPKMWDYYDKAIRKYPNVLYTHTADMIASKIRGV
jgi:HD superfamily phosphohydrolase YqeK